MAYLWRNIDFTTYGIVAGHIESGNVALQGCFDFPSRIGDISHEWGDEDGIEVYSASADFFFGGRDLKFAGHLVGTRSSIYSNLQSLYTEINAASGLNVLSTPYGNFSVYVKMADPSHFRDISKLEIQFREPVVILTGGALPSTGTDPYTINDIPMRSFGLYACEYKSVISLPEMQQQYYTKAEAEGYQVSKRQAVKLEFTGLLLATNLTVFQSNIKNLYALFKTAGDMSFKFNSEISGTCYFLDGFKVDKIYFAENGIVAEFKTLLTVNSFTPL